MDIGETYTRLPPTEVFELFLNDLGTTTDDKLLLRQSLVVQLPAAQPTQGLVGLLQRGIMVSEVTSRSQQEWRSSSRRTRAPWQN
jgi:hypothetical protein